MQPRLFQLMMKQPAFGNTLSVTSKCEAGVLFPRDIQAVKSDN